MFSCVICEKQVHGHPTTNKDLVCGSCALSKSDAAVNAGGKTLSDVLSLVDQSIQNVDTPPSPAGHKIGTHMSFIRVKSNYLRDRAIVLGGKHSLKFNSDGEARCPVSLKTDLEDLMRVRPGRFRIIEAVENAKAQEALNRTVDGLVTEEQYAVPERGVAIDKDDDPPKAEEAPEAPKAEEAPEAPKAEEAPEAPKAEEAPKDKPPVKAAPKRKPGRPKKKK